MKILAIYSTNFTYIKTVLFNNLKEFFSINRDTDYVETECLESLREDCRYDVEKRLEQEIETDDQLINTIINDLSFNIYSDNGNEVYIRYPYDTTILYASIKEIPIDHFEWDEVNDAMGFA